MKILGVIPARYASTRFPAKALTDIKGKTMVQRVYEQAQQAQKLVKVVVATDHPDIEAHVRQFGGHVVMTSADHPSGTDRCYEALQKTEEEFDAVLNIQGDEPFIQPQQIDRLADCLIGAEAPLATLVRVIDDESTLFNPNTPKVVLDQQGRALYFSRQPIPYQRDTPTAEWLSHHMYYQHIGLYAYRVEALHYITTLTPSALEIAERLEQLRWLEAGLHIQAAVTAYASHGIDTPEDLHQALKNWEATEKKNP
ncbi:3-deoxy-manno-octulosonate cytidylyltransferase (CMP-KDO synthetase) [Catalinimonas alkaloidigena]|uniref:3-deoxy-manno-octulosonate cytidylyltransferase n=1 Tax=Catalinimonas alkaloidigena TaxID=1075417 RepID=A0A1G9GUW8_9BACT|nr:3-deoxy-manno-octulosonate cytidylyltransferase [Catalinimonas alkaloidigena]SDL04467.1 3-deoxy-manno-octulosonate cytidylyltransferase (CMP-KDO synthetase) [Catalinimonas alkaloidigena]